MPAIKASRVRPIAALRDVAVDRSGLSFGRAVAGVVLTGAGVAAFAAGRVVVGPGALPLLGLGAITVILGVFTLGAVLVRPVMWLLGTPVRLLGVTGRFARQNVSRNPKRTAATSSALMIGVALVGFITILAASTKASITDLVGSVLPFGLRRGFGLPEPGLLDHDRGGGPVGAVGAGPSRRCA